jgi:hypothetical protein
MKRWLRRIRRRFLVGLFGTWKYRHLRCPTCKAAYRPQEEWVWREFADAPCGHGSFAIQWKWRAYRREEERIVNDRRLLAEEIVKAMRASGVKS